MLPGTTRGTSVPFFGFFFLLNDWSLTRNRRKLVFFFFFLHCSRGVPVGHRIFHAVRTWQRSVESA